MPTASRSASYWIACNNFYVLTRYNRSRLYATAVWELANAIRLAHSAREQAPSFAGVRDDRAHVRDEPARRCVGRLGQRCVRCERGDDRRRQRLAELDAELVERVDAEEHRFDERAMLVEREQLAEPIAR